MSKYQITFEVDNRKLFDLLHKNKDLWSTIGQRLVEAMLCPNEISWLDHVGFNFYEIEVKEVKRIE